MNPKQLADEAGPAKLADYLANLPQPPHHGHGPGGAVETLREDHHKGHHIVIRTTYRIEVDGKVLQVPLALGNDGQLHCHSLPNYQFASAVDMVKTLIDNFPEEFQGPADQPGGHGPHQHAEGGR